MNSFSIFMIIFGICILLVGLYMFRGNELKVTSWKAAFKGLNKSGWKNVGKWTIIASIIPFVLVVWGIIFDFE